MLQVNIQIQLVDQLLAVQQVFIVQKVLLDQGRALLATIVKLILKILEIFLVLLGNMEKLLS